MTNVVPLFGPKKVAQTTVVPQSIEGPILAIMDWAESNGIDIHNNIAFQFRLADFMALLQTEIEKKEAACG